MIKELKAAHRSHAAVADIFHHSLAYRPVLPLERPRSGRNAPGVRVLVEECHDVVGRLYGLGVGLGRGFGGQVGPCLSERY